MKKLICFFIIICIYVASYPQATDLVVDCQTPGWLSSKVNYSDQQTVRNIKVTGYINSDDLHFIGSLMENYQLRGRIDLSEVGIVGNKMDAYTNNFGITHDASYTIQYLALPKSLTEISRCMCSYKGQFSYWLKVDTLEFSPNNINYVRADFFDSRQFQSSIKHLILGEKIDSIPDNAFYDCGGVSSLKMPTGMRYIGKRAFYENYQSIKDVNFNELTNLKYIGPGAFCGGYQTTTDYQPDTLIIPKSLDNPFILFAFSYRDGQHIFIDENIKEVSGNCIGIGGAETAGYTTAALNIHINSKTPPSIIAYNGKNSDTKFGNSTIYVPKGAKQAYLNSDWKYATIIEVTPTYTLSITAIGNGSVSYEGTTTRGETNLFEVEEGLSATITFSPDNGYRIKSVKVNNINVTSSVSNNKYTINGINGDTTVEVEYEAIPTCTLTISASGNGSAIFEETSVRNETKTFTVNLGGSYSIHPQTDAGYELKTVKLYENGVFVRSGVPAYDYHIDNIITNTRLEFEFSTNYTLSIKVKGNGFVSYNGTKIENNTSSFSIKEGKSATLTFTPDAGYRIKSLIVNNADVTSNVSNNSYTINSISGDTNVEVEFEAIPPTTYTLSIKATGNGSASYNGTTIRGKTSTFTVNEGISATITFSPDNGYRIKSVKLNSADVTSSVSGNQYTIDKISANTTLEVEFETIPPTTYTLSIKATGNGSAAYNGTTIRDKTNTFTIDEGTSAVITFNPDNGNRIKSIKVNSADVTSSVSSNQYTINNISANTTLEVEFEAIPATTYALSIKVTGNGSASYNGTTIRSKTGTFTVNEGTSATITFSPDNGYRIKSVKLNSADVTSSVSSNQYTINNIAANTTLEVEFEAIPVTTYTLSITATGNGYASYNGTTIRSKTNSFIVNEGTSVSISITPDNGYRIKSVKENNTNVTSYVSSGTYTISSISRDTNLEVEFEAIPPTTYTLSIIATGNGYVSYNGTTTRNGTNSFTVNEGDNALLSFIPESGYRLASVRVNYSDVTYWVYDNQYTISNISSDTTVEVKFEAIPVPTYSLSITASGNGSATYNGSAIRNRTTSFTVDEGTSATITFTPDNGNSIASVKLNNSDVTTQISGNSYTINNITANTTLAVTFLEDVNALTVDGLNYMVTSQSNKTVTLTSGGTGLVLTVPATITQNGITWKVTGIDKDALKGNTELAAIIWNPEAAFTATVSNPNLLLYVKSSDYAPATIQNVVVNGTASNIVLAEAQSGNNFYCPQSFVAQKISFTHNYKMQTGIGEARGWETITLPFDVQIITHATKGTIKPFANWKSGDAAKPFWLMELTGTGFVETGSIKAYTPYIISMPNNPQYDSQWLLNGKVTFAASSVTIGKTEQLQEVTYKDRTFITCYVEKGAAEGFYALNVSNEYETNNSGMTDGSRFVLNMRKIHPFEAYMTTSSNAPEWSIGIFEDMTTGMQMMVDGRWMKEDVVYDLQGRKVNAPSKKGVYIVNGKKKMIK